METLSENIFSKINTKKRWLLNRLSKNSKRKFQRISMHIMDDISEQYTTNIATFGF